MNVEPVTIDLSTRYDPRRNKRQMVFHAAPEIYKLYGGAMGGGKTAAIINEGIQLSLDYPGNFGLLVRKTWPSFRDTTLPQLEYFLDRRLVKSWNLTSKLIELMNGSRIRYGGLGDDPDDWRNWMSGEYGWIALEQAEDFTEEEFRMLATRLRLKVPGIRYFFLLSCNPSLGWLKDRFIMGNQPDHIFIPALPEDNLENLPPDYIARMEAVLDENQKKALLKGDWDAIGEPDNVYSYHKVSASIKRKAIVLEPVEIGVDVARQGDDETVIVVRKGLKVEIRKHYCGHDLMTTTGQIWIIAADLIKEYRGELLKLKIKVDADGLGAGVVDRLNEQRKEKEERFTELVPSLMPEKRANELKERGFKVKVEIAEIHGAAKARDTLRFKNRRAEIHWALRELQDDIELPDDRELLTQLMAIKYKVNSAGQIEIEAKEDIKKRLGKQREHGGSPDRAEAVIYALAPAETPGQPKIWRAG